MVVAGVLALVIFLGAHIMATYSVLADQTGYGAAIGVFVVSVPVAILWLRFREGTTR